MQFYQTQQDIEPIKWAVKFNPARIALEYYCKPFNSNYLLEIDLEEKIKSFQSAQKIAELIYKTYPDVLSKHTIPESQVVRLINKIMAHKKTHTKQSPSPTNKNVNPINETEVFPLKHSIISHNTNNYSGSSGSVNPLTASYDLDDENKKIDYSKSNQNFFTTGKNNNINFIDQTNQDENAHNNTNSNIRDNNGFNTNNVSSDIIKKELEFLNKGNRYNDEEKTEEESNTDDINNTNTSNRYSKYIVNNSEEKANNQEDVDDFEIDI